MNKKILGFITKLALSAVAAGWVISLIESWMIASTCFFMFRQERLELIDLLLAIAIASLQLLGTLDLSRIIAGRNHPKKKASKDFWNHVHFDLPWAVKMRSTLHLGAALITSLYVYIQTSELRSLARHQTSAKFELYDPSSPTFLLLIATGFLGIGLLVGVLGFRMILLPMQLKRWMNNVNTSESASESVHILNLMTTTNLYLEKFQAAEETSALMLKVATAKEACWK